MRAPAAPVPEFAASIDWRDLAGLLAHALVAAGISVALFYGTGAPTNSSAGPFFAFGTLFLFVAAGAILYWRRRDLGGKALAVGALAAVVILSIIYPGADPSTARAFAYFGPLAMIGTLTTFQLVVIIAMLALLAAVGNIAAQLVARFRRGREGQYGQVVGLLTRAPRKPLLAPLAPASGQRRTVVIACLMAVPTLILVSAQLTNAMSENEYRAQNYVIASAVIGLLAGFLAARLAGILGLGAIVLGAAIGLLANVLTWIGQSILAAVTDGAFAWDSLNGPFYFGRDFARYETTLYYAVAMALAVLAGNLLAQGAQIYLGADTARRRGFVAALTTHPIAATLAGLLLAAAGSYIAFRFAIYPYCVGHTPLTLPGLCST